MTDRVQLNAQPVADAAAVYDVLIKECGAPPSDKQDFVRHFDEWRRIEWRFQGDLGFGGKLWKQTGPQPRLLVTCYREDETPERLAMIAKANERLAALL